MNMPKALIITKGHLSETDIIRASFQVGLERHGWLVVCSYDYEPCDLLVIWGVRRQDIIARQKAIGGEVCVLERGYLGDRFKYSSVSFGGGLNGRGEFRGDLSDPSRFNHLFPDLLKPWRHKPEGYALIIGQVPGDMSLRHANIDAWYQQTAKALKNSGYVDVFFRSHPKANCSAPQGIKRLEGTLQEALNGAALVITFNSNTGVEAACSGVPTIAMDQGSMAWEVAGHQVTEVITPDRESWASALAWKQWALDEMTSGYCIEAIGL